MEPSSPGCIQIPVFLIVLDTETALLYLLLSKTESHGYTMVHRVYPKPVKNTYDGDKTGFFVSNSLNKWKPWIPRADFIRKTLKLCQPQPLENHTVV